MASKSTRSQIVAALSFGLLPYIGGLLVIITRNILWLTVAGAVICIASTTGHYLLRKITDPVYARHRLIADPILFGSEFAFTAILVRYVFMRSG